MSIMAGKMRHTVRIEQRVAAQDGAATTYTWTLFAERKAQVEPQRGNEQIEARQRVGKVTTRFTMRYLAGVLPTMRIVWDNRPHDIISVYNVDGIKKEMVIIAERVEADVDLA